LPRVCPSTSATTTACRCRRAALGSNTGLSSGAPPCALSEPPPNPSTES
jgi:hypothetical protein